MMAILVRSGARYGEVDNPDNHNVIVVNDTRGYANDVYVRLSDGQFHFKDSKWCGLNEVKP